MAENGGSIGGFRVCKVHSLDGEVHMSPNEKNSRFLTKQLHD